MTEINLKKLCFELIQTFFDAGKKSLELRKLGLKKEIKSDNTPVTNGDIEVNKLLTKKIEILTPEIPIVSEESSLNKSESNLINFWLIDPIDGTFDYINNKDEFTLNASLVINKIPELCLTYLVNCNCHSVPPYSNSQHSAGRPPGASCITKDLKEAMAAAIDASCCLTLAPTAKLFPAQVQVLSMSQPIWGVMRAHNFS